MHKILVALMSIGFVGCATNVPHHYAQLPMIDDTIDRSTRITRVCTSSPLTCIDLDMPTKIDTIRSDITRGITRAGTLAYTGSPPTCRD